MTKTLPDIYLFNPTCEYAVANGQKSWQPNLLLQAMEEDLGTLPLFFASPNDVVLVKKLPSLKYSTNMKKAGIHLPEFVHFGEVAPQSNFALQPKNSLRPWGWSPAVHHFLAPVKNSCTPDFQNSPIVHWKPEFREIYSKKFALGILKTILPQLPDSKKLPDDLIPEICRTQPEVEKLLKRWGKIMIKAPWSSSGRGLQKITKSPVGPKIWEKILGTVKDQGYVIVEPYLNKVLDVALQFEIFEGKVQYKGISRFFTDEKGQYQGNYLNGWPEKSNFVEVLFAETLPELLINPITEAIEKSYLASVYEGVFGVDTLIFRDNHGDIRVNPCLEINVRHTMGLLSIQVEKLLASRMRGIFKIYFQPGTSFQDFQDEMHLNFPPVFSNKKLQRGFFPLTPANDNTYFGAYLLAGR